MANTAFETAVRLQLDRYAPEEAKRIHIAVAKAGLAQFMSRQSAKPGVTIETDGHIALDETAVQPFGVIVYRFLRMQEIVALALLEAKRLSPVLSGRYRNSWFVMAGGQEVAPEEVPNTMPVMVLNDQPYARKINVGARGFEAYAGIVEKVRQLVLGKYRTTVDAETQYVTLQGGYILQRHLRKIQNGRRYGGPRNDALKGMPITYPALVITPKQYA